MTALGPLAGVLLVALRLLLVAAAELTVNCPASIVVYPDNCVLRCRLEG